MNQSWRSILLMPALALIAMVPVAAVWGLEGDPLAGRDATAACVACHAVDGNSPSDAFPNLAGQGFLYLYRQLKDIRDGNRPVAEMEGQLDGLSDQQLADMAAYYASQSAQLGMVDEQWLAEGERIYRRGLPERSVPACAGCHAPNGMGLAEASFPRLGGQHPAYIVDQLLQYQNGERQGPHGMMNQITQLMSRSQMEAVAAYASGLHD